MDPLSPAEEVVIGLLRGENAVDFVMNVAWLGPRWTVSFFAEGDGLLAGTGNTFREAFRGAFKAEADPGDSGEPAKPTKLRLIGGTAQTAAKSAVQ